MADKLARLLRENATDAERILWAELRAFKRGGMHFRRQAPFGRYIVDFVCHSRRLVVELDGSQHGAAGAVEYDEQRTAYLNSRGYRVIRFGNWEIFQELPRVVDAIARIAALPPPEALRASTSPQGGGEK
ncbi:MAG: endonuclease domain-containing protein [Alphaproteobacteria bacterium]|nr:endonuclease domain-containing protein [Alphaproteobacteria bacterium]MBV9693173.1 endonuclease domain-containing protein [Alphaproteobacteria bacterium]